MKTIMTTLMVLCAVVSGFAGEADVIDVRVEHVGDRHFTFFVTVQHADESWDHYADRWEVLGPQGKILATRVLHHPHVNEQPFTRSKGGIKIDESIKKVTLRAHDSVHAFGGKTITVTLPK